MISPTALRALAAQLEQAGWTSVVATQRGGLVALSGLSPQGRQISSCCGYRAASALVSQLIAQEEQG